MNKFFTVVFLLTTSFTYAQNVKMGKFSDEEINFKQVSYEPDAGAVVLWEEGESQFFSGLLETTYLFRVKILSDAGKEHADVRVRYYLGDNKTENIFSVKAQITNFNGTAAETIKLDKENIFDVDLGNGLREMRITFPNVQVGSILEYTYKKADKNLTFLDGWTFQNPIPTLGSHYQIKMNPNFDYKMISQGFNLINNAEISNEYGIYKWTLRNLFSLKEEPYMKNYRDYIERIEFQLSQYQTNTDNMGPQWKDVLNTWELLGDELISTYRDKGFYRSNPIEKELLDADISGDTQLEIAQKAYYYVRDNFTAEGEDFIYADQQINQLLKTRIGSPQELSLLLMGILKSQGISCDPILIGSKGNGRTNIVPFPFLTQFDEILLKTELDGKVQYLDLSDKVAPFGYVDLDKHVLAGLYLRQGESTLIPLEFKHSSNKIYFSEVNLEGSDLVMKNTLRHYYYEGLDWNKAVSNLEKQKEPLDKLFSSDGMMSIKEIEVDNSLTEKNYVSTNFKIVLESAGDQDMIVFNPIKYSSFSKNPFTQEYRIFPVDFEYAFTETSNVNIKIPEGYELDDYPEEGMMTIAGNSIIFSYSAKPMNDVLVVASKLMVKNPLIPAAQYADLKYLMESIASKLNEPVVLKKKVNP